MNDDHYQYMIEGWLDLKEVKSIFVNTAVCVPSMIMKFIGAITWQHLYQSLCNYLFSAS